MDIKQNPGPIEVAKRVFNFEIESTDKANLNSNFPASVGFNYSRAELLHLREFKSPLQNHLAFFLKSLGIFRDTGASSGLLTKYRRSRGGKAARLRESRKKQFISTIVTPDRRLAKSIHGTVHSNVNVNNLITIKKQYKNPSKTLTSESLRLGLFNARSINNKALFVKDLFVDQKLDLMALKETRTK